MFWGDFDIFSTIFWVENNIDGKVDIKAIANLIIVVSIFDHTTGNMRIYTLRKTDSQVSAYETQKTSFRNVISILDWKRFERGWLRLDIEDSKGSATSTSCVKFLCILWVRRCWCIYDLNDFSKIRNFSNKNKVMGQAFYRVAHRWIASL